MTDDKSVEVQLHELQKIAHEILSEGINLDDQFQVAVIIDKLPPSWKDFKNQLRHKTNEFSLESLITRLRIDEEARKQELKEEIQFSCYNCGKPGDLAHNCRNKRIARPISQANLTIDQLVAMISEVTLS
ncbi:hypothetical protein Ddye_005084 [Dipteronia dyeriana]|uniref:CCHC-type domain-containing protein n=1 Tax=Dipteronia dyeriana TaxID=168575 RepID=A0AAD9XG32_9ROSI|nr:hypothetical protein Ddye_005084 [Dipteronia dyeriana]